MGSKQLEEYFENYSDYVRFLENMADMFEDISFGRKASTSNPITSKGSVIIKFPAKGKIKPDGYYIRVNKMSTPTLG